MLLALLLGEYRGDVVLSFCAMCYTCLAFTPRFLLFACSPRSARTLAASERVDARFCRLIPATRVATRQSVFRALFPQSCVYARLAVKCVKRLARGCVGAKSSLGVRIGHLVSAVPPSPWREPRASKASVPDESRRLRYVCNPFYPAFVLRKRIQLENGSVRSPLYY